MDELSEKLFLDLRAELLAQDLLLKAVIATLPRREEVRAAFQVILSHHESLALDRGMQIGLPPEGAREMAELLKQKTDLLLAFLQAS